MSSLLVFLLIFSQTEPYFLSADSMEVITEEGRVSYLRGNVTLTHGNTVITGETGIVYEKEERAILKGGVKIVDDSTEIFAESATYYKNESKAVLKDNVAVKTPNETIFADSMVYFRISEKTYGFGNIRILNKEEDLLIEGEEGYYDLKNEYGRLYKKPVLKLKGEEEIEVRSGCMELFQNLSKVVATHNVSIKTERMDARCDSLVYFIKDETASLLGNPIMSEKENSIEGEVITIYFTDEEVKEALVCGSAYGEYKLEDGINRTYGDTIRIEFKESKMHLISVEGNARGEYERIEHKEVN